MRSQYKLYINGVTYKNFWFKQFRFFFFKSVKNNNVNTFINKKFKSTDLVLKSNFFFLNFSISQLIRKILKIQIFYKHKVIWTIIGLLIRSWIEIENGPKKIRSFISSFFGTKPSRTVDDSNLRIKKKLAGLTKKQRKKVKVKKMSKLIYPDSKLFKESGSYSRSMKVSFLDIGKDKFVHDGYSWRLIKFSAAQVNFKSGMMCHKTRSLSPVIFFDKQQGAKKKIIKMKQKGTFKVKKTKVKRKK